MSTPNIVLARIDNRLVHGQVGNAWVGQSGTNLIIVADDDAAADPIQQSLMKMTAEGAHVGIRFFTLDKTIEIIHKASDKQKIFLVMKTPASARKLVENGVPLKEINVGNMHFSGDKRIYHESHVYVDDQDVADFEAIKAAGVSLQIQILPGNLKYNI